MKEVKDLFRPESAKQFVDRMVTDIKLSNHQLTNPSGNVSSLRSILELSYLINSKDVHRVLSLARLYMMHNIETLPVDRFVNTHRNDFPVHHLHVLEMLQKNGIKRHISLDARNKEIKRKVRSSDVKYAIGMAMKHCKYNYVCVIYDWDPICMASAEWQKEMGVETLQFGKLQPFYNVLVEDGSQRYAAQENLSLTHCTGCLDANELLGRYFSHFFINHYVPNAEKENEYSEDADVRNMFCQQMITQI